MFTNHLETIEHVNVYNSNDQSHVSTEMILLAGTNDICQNKCQYEQGPMTCVNKHVNISKV